MAVSFIAGRSGTGKTTKILQKIIGEAREKPQGPPIIYLVPDQMTFQSEMQLISAEQKGMTRVQVLSFSRLALRVLQETGGISKYFIQKTGINMILKKIIEKEKENFLIFANASDTTGFIEQMEGIITEFKRYKITPDIISERYKELDEKEELVGSEQVLHDKLHDIQLIFQGLNDELAGQYVDSEDYLLILAEKIPDSSFLKHAQVYVDGFHSFTPLEYEVLFQLMKHVAKVTFSLTMDRLPGPNESYDILDTFFETYNTYGKITTICKEESIPLNDPTFLHEQKRLQKEGLIHLEENFDVIPPKISENAEGIRLMTAVNRRTEVEGVAREILALTRDEGYRYRDIAILLRNIGDYGDLLETIFKDYNIPLFMDQKRSMLNHPVIEFIRSSLEVLHGNWHYEAVFRALKTDLLFTIDQDVGAMRERVDQLENYVLSYGIQGSKWYKKEPWTYGSVRTSKDKESEKEWIFEEEVNQLRHSLISPLVDFKESMKLAKTVKEYCEVIFAYLERCDIAQKIEKMRDKSLEEDVQRTREHDQVWGAVIELLDQMVEMIGQERISFQLFKKMFDTGLESLQFSIIPPALDQVIVADMEHSRLSKVKCAFIIGVNDGVIPRTPDESSIITEDERVKLEKEMKLELAPSATQQLLGENFLLYLAQSTPSEKLYFTYPLADHEGKSLQGSIVLKRLQDIFPGLEDELWLNEPTDLVEEDQLAFINGPRKTLSFLTYELQSWKKGYPIPHFWWDVYNWYMTNPRWKKPATYILQSLFYGNKAKPLSLEQAQDLYGDELTTSVSRMEMFQSCPFSQFANYGLLLKERDLYKLEAPDIGILFHAALSKMGEVLKKEGKDFSNLSKEECALLAKQIVEELAPQIQSQILLSSHRNSYITKKLEEIIARTAYVLSQQSKQSEFIPIGLELAFGPEEELPPLTFQLKNGSKMELVGRIDRVDKAESDRGVLLRVIDYKSSEKNIDLLEVYYGLSLQMLIYLDVVVSFSEHWLGVEASPAGVLYFHVHNPIIKSNEQLTIEEIEEKLFKAFKMKGVIQADEEIAKLMDTSLESGYSSIIPAGLSKKGDFYANSSIITEENFEYLRSFLRNKVKNIGDAITEGQLSITPSKYKKKLACTYCAFKPVCQFDTSLEENDYNRLPKINREDIFAKMKKEGGEEDEL